MRSLRELLLPLKGKFADLEESNRLGRLLVYLVRLLDGIIRVLADTPINLWAMSLAYTTMLSLVPLLAVSFSVLKAFGGYQQLEPLLFESLAPLGPQGAKVAENILIFVGNLKVGVLGSLGVALLFYTVISMLQTVEQAFNAIWHVPNARSWVRRFSDYLSVILVGPVLIFAALGVSASVMNSQVVHELRAIEPFGTVILSVGKVVPYLLICGAFAFSYAFITNTTVRLGAALAGGVFAGVLWYTSGMIFAAFVASSSSYSGIYSGFAGAVLFIVWLKIGWLVILLGAQVACYWQHPHLLNLLDGGKALAGRYRERLALEIMTLISDAHYHDKPLWTLNALEARYLGIPPGVVNAIVQGLLRDKLIMASNNNPPYYLPAHDIETIKLADVVAVVRGGNEAGSQLPAVDKVIGQVDSAVAQALQKTVKDLIVSGLPAPTLGRIERV